jgi:1-hydroxycarotenoid 3,4-desaturase
MQPPALSASNSAAVIGGGVGGLACAIRLAAAGMKVNLFESHGHLGGKIRTIDSAAGPVDAGPTVLTMRHVFDDLFAAAGQRLEDHVTLVPQPTLARHFWADGSTLDLHADKDANIAAVTDFAGAKAAQQFQAFCDRCAKLFDAFDAPMMQSASPSLMELSRHVMARPSLIPAMAPLSSLAGMLKRQFDDPRLQQLFGRYATYVGGSPLQSPALLALIWQAEAAGVWVVEGGMHKLAEAMGHVAQDLGVEIHLDTPVARIEHQGGRATGIVLEDGTRQAADKVVFNGDPRALATGLLGQGTAHLVPKSRTADRSLSARVHSFAATPTGLDLLHHNVLFADVPNSEFKDIKAGKTPSDATLYICAEDRGTAAPPPALERFEIITNAAPIGQTQDDQEELETWHQQTLTRMRDSFGLSFSPSPSASSITTPQMFHAMFPGSLGSLYGQTPHGMLAAFERPLATTAVTGLYLAGGGCHPGAGVPMATLSGRHAAEAILQDQTSASTSAPMATRGGTLTA